jgi:hypothetical protein
MSINTTIPNYQKYYKSKVTIPFGQLQTVIDWCDRNCRCDWRYTDNVELPLWLKEITPYLPTPPLYTFMFEDERDYMAFMLVHE